MNSIQIKIPIPGKAHLQARAFAGTIPNLELAERVYLNTLAVYAVADWLEQRGIATHWEESDSWEPNVTTPPDSADLEVVGVGKIECRPVLPDARDVKIPPTTITDRVAYIAVGLGESLDSAQLIGFVYQYPVDTFTLSLRLFRKQSMEALPQYLRTIRQVMTAIEEQEDHPLRMLAAKYPEVEFSVMVANLEQIFHLETDLDLQNRRVGSWLQECESHRVTQGREIAVLSDEEEQEQHSEEQRVFAQQIALWYRETRSFHINPL